MLINRIAKSHLFIAKNVLYQMPAEAGLHRHIIKISASIWWGSARQNVNNMI